MFAKNCLFKIHVDIQCIVLQCLCVVVTEFRKYIVDASFIYRNERTKSLQWAHKNDRLNYTLYIPLYDYVHVYI